MADASDLNARPVVLQRFLEAPFDGAVVALLFHVDEVDHDEAGEVAQAELAGDLVGCFEIGLERRVLDIVLAGGLAGIDVDRHQRLCLVDHQIAAGGQGHGRGEQRIELALHLEAREQRPRVLIGLHVARMTRHEHLHEVLGFAIAVVALDQDLVDILGVEVANRALDQASFLIDEAWRHRFEGQVADILPKADEIVEIALDLRLGAARRPSARSGPCPREPQCRGPPP